MYAWMSLLEVMRSLRWTGKRETFIQTYIWINVAINIADTNVAVAQLLKQWLSDMEDDYERQA